MVYVELAIELTLLREERKSYFVPTEPEQV